MYYIEYIERERERQRLITNYYVVEVRLLNKNIIPTMESA